MCVNLLWELSVWNRFVFKSDSDWVSTVLENPPSPFVPPIPTPVSRYSTIGRGSPV